MSDDYVPARGDIVWLDFDPQAGHEQAGRRPGLVVSPEAYNRKVGLALCCPITNRSKGYPFEVRLPKGCGATGVVLSDQLRNLDGRVRKAKKMGSVAVGDVSEVLAKIRPLLFG